ncbi:phage/plasmid primase, P4 family [Nonomuraea sp. NPDC046570]|uniref:phage/plasmid primase, P4 family n=1 Tax=Nonomuraea sp. NPDC046570 TaxID=3155255 RepID=UPI0033F6979E
MFILTVGRREDGSPDKKSFGKWNKDEFPGPTSLETIEYDMSWGNKCGIWVRVPDEWVVVDPDSDEAVEYWTERLGDVLEKAAVSQPPHGRPHWWFRIPAGSQGVFRWSAPSSNKNNIRFDVLGQRRGGVMAPPSEHHKGGRRAWIKGLDEAKELTSDETALLARHTLPGAPPRAGDEATPLGPPRAPKYTNGEGTKYGNSALRSEVNKLRKVWRADDGTFNNTLNSGGFGIGQLVAGGELDHEFAYDILTELLDELGAPTSEYRTRDSGYFDGFDRPRASTAFDSEFFGLVNGREGQLLASTLADAILKEGPIGVGTSGHLWAYRDGVWKIDKHAVRVRASKLLSEAFRVRHAMDVEAVIRSRAPEIECEPVPKWINFRNGLLDWEQGKLHPHSPDALSTVQLHTEWDPEAQCPEFDRFLASVLPADMVDMVWELIGYLMYSGNPLHKAVMLHGSGRNGKGTWIRVIKTLLGDENVTAVTLQSLNMERFAAASLFGKIANIAGDIDGTYLEQTAKFKAITGEDVITAEFKNRDPFDFTPWAVPVFSANKIPGSADVTTGYMSRWVVVPFPNDFTGKEDRHLAARLQRPEEIRGIAAKAVPALQRLMARGNFDEPPSALEAMAEFKRRTNQLESWLDECCERTPDTWAERVTFYDAYRRWAEHGRYGVLKAAEFYDRMRNAGIEEAKRKGTRGFKGVTVTNDYDKTAPYRANWDRSRN